MPFFVYILSNPAERLYVGHTSDVELRLRRHNDGRVRSTKNRGPWNLVYSEEFSTRSAAMAREKELKALKSREAILKLMSRR